MKTIGNTDSHFVIGKKHVTQSAPCQDHALAMTADDMLVAVVSDGCSSGRFTDIGARIITCATLSVVREALVVTQDTALLPEFIHQMLVVQSQKTAEMMGLDNQDLLATCAYAVVLPDAGFIHILGDGHAVIKYTNGDMKLINTEWQHNTPYYPADNRKAQFIANHSEYNDGAESLSVETVLVQSGSGTTSKELIPITAAVKGFVLHITKEELETIEVIMVMSDGISRFKKDGTFINPAVVATRLSAFKNWVGAFVKRRLSRGLNELAQEFALPDDDVACAAIHLHKNEII